LSRCRICSSPVLSFTMKLNCRISSCLVGGIQNQIHCAGRRIPSRRRRNCSNRHGSRPTKRRVLRRRRTCRRS
jgi:hypothetical protein